LNYIYHAQRDLTEDETFGLAAMFNSTLLDRYFRTISGNTQVNATEIRSMNFPDLETLGRIGQRIRLAPTESDPIVLEELGVPGSLRNHLLGQVA
jgi:adenine-specific DNA-methyltransferase